MKNHPTTCIISDLHNGITTRKKDCIEYAKLIANIYYTSPLEFVSVTEALKDEFWISVMQEELPQFQRNNVWTLVPKPDNANVIGTK